MYVYALMKWKVLKISAILSESNLFNSVFNRFYCNFNGNSKLSNVTTVYCQFEEAEERKKVYTNSHVSQKLTLWKKLPRM